MAYPPRARLGTNGGGPAPQPDPSRSTLPDSGYTPDYGLWLPLLAPSGARGVVSVPTALRLRPPGPAQRGGGGVPPDVQALAGGGVAMLSDTMPWLFPPGDAFPLLLFGGPTAIAAGSTASIIIMPQLPRGTKAVFKRYAEASTDFVNTVWNFLIRNRPVSPIANKSGFQFGQMNDPRPLPGPGVVLDSGDDFVVTVQNISLAAVTVSARVEGYQWPVRSGR